MPGLEESIASSSWRRDFEILFKAEGLARTRKRAWPYMLFRSPLFSTAVLDEALIGALIARAPENELPLEQREQQAITSLLRG
jgi:hypothetical protein